MERKILKRMDEEGIYPSERLGQHILINNRALSIFTNNILNGSSVVEIGAGPGNVTERVAQRAKRVFAFEIDRKFEPVLSELQEEHPNIEIIYKDVLGANLEKLMKSRGGDATWQIISNLPFHITEPFVKKLITLPIVDAILILGKQMVERIRNDNPSAPDFSRTGLTVQTFFETDVQMRLPSGYFYPEPATDSAIVVLTPRDSSEFRGNRKLSILRRLFLSEGRHPSIQNVIKEDLGNFNNDSLRDKHEKNRYDRRQTKQNLRGVLKYNALDLNSEQSQHSSRGKASELDLPANVLNKPFSKLDNQSLRELVSALDRL